jgi:hypothetical protein
LRARPSHVGAGRRAITFQTEQAATIGWSIWGHPAQQSFLLWKRTRQPFNRRDRTLELSMGALDSGKKFVKARVQGAGKCIVVIS